MLRSLSLSIPRTGRPGCCAISLFVTLRGTDTATNPPPLPPRCFRHHGTNTTRENDAEIYAESKSRATPSCSLSFSSSLTPPLPPSLRGRNTHSFSHTHARMHFSPFRRSLVRSVVLSRESGTHPGGFRLRCRPRDGADAALNLIARFRFYAAPLSLSRSLSPTRSPVSRDVRIVRGGRGFSRDGRKRDAQRDKRASLVTKHSRRTATHGYDGASAEIGTARPRSVASAAPSTSRQGRRHVLAAPRDIIA